MPDLLLLGLAAIFALIEIPVAVSWRRSRDGYIDQYLRGDPDGRFNYKMHLLCLGALPIGAVMFAIASFAERT